MNLLVSNSGHDFMQAAAIASLILILMFDQSYADDQPGTLGLSKNPGATHLSLSIEGQEGLSLAIDILPYLSTNCSTAHISFVDLTDHSALPIWKLRKLDSIWLRRCSINAGTFASAKYSEVNMVRLEDCPIDSSVIRSLEKLNRLQYLALCSDRSNRQRTCTE